jgi:hypothetical protein
VTVNGGGSGNGSVGSNGSVQITFNP